MHAATRLRSAASGLAAIALCSCGLEQSGTRPEPTRFLKSTGVNRSQRLARLPFEHASRAPAVDMTQSKHIVVRMVTPGFLGTEQWENSKSALIPNKRELFPTVKRSWLSIFQPPGWSDMRGSCKSRGSDSGFIRTR
jgi:hypothetical protein